MAVTARLEGARQLRVDTTFVPRIDRRLRAGVVPRGSTAFEDAMAEVREAVFLPWAWFHYHLHGTITVHGAAVAMARGAVLILGLNGAGKSTVMTELVRIGGRMLSDNFVPLRRDGFVLPFPDVARSASPPTGARILFHAHGKAAYVDSRVGVADSAPLRACVFLTRRKTTACIELTRDDAERRMGLLQELVPELIEGSPYSLFGGESPWSPENASHANLPARAATVLSGSRCFELSLLRGDSIPPEILECVT